MTQELLYKNEKFLFVIAAIISGIFWTAVIVGTLGIALIYGIMFFLFYLFAHSALISYLKGTGVKVSPEQFPDIHEQLQQCCEKLNISEIPETYVLHADGAFNAFATRFLRRNYVVLFSDVIDALNDNKESLKFYIGHELGHIHRKHLFWSPILFPALIDPPPQKDKTKNSLITVNHLCETRSNCPLIILSPRQFVNSLSHPDHVTFFSLQYVS